MKSIFKLSTAAFVVAVLGAGVEPVAESDAGVWQAPEGTPWGAYSPGGAGVTLWKGFQRGHAQGMTLQRAKSGQALSLR